MRDHLITSTLFFQDLLCSHFQRLTQQIVETLVLLCVSHLFGLYNPNQVSENLKVMRYLMVLQISISERRTFHQIRLQLTGERQMLIEFMAHFHKPNPKEP